MSERTGKTSPSLLHAREKRERMFLAKTVVVAARRVSPSLFHFETNARSCSLTRRTAPAAAIKIWRNLCHAWRSQGRFVCHSQEDLVKLIASQRISGASTSCKTNACIRPGRLHQAYSPGNTTARNSEFHGLLGVSSWEKLGVEWVPKVISLESWCSRQSTSFLPKKRSACGSSRQARYTVDAHDSVPDTIDLNKINWRPTMLWNWPLQISFI